MPTLTPFCGLDFGTSNSTIGTWQNNAPTLAYVENSHLTIPSAIFFDFETATPHFGRTAIAHYYNGKDGRLMRALKSVLGTPLMKDKTYIGANKILFTEVLGTFIKHLKTQAENFSQQSIEHVVLGRPVFFIDNNPTADKEAQNTLEQVAKEQGFKHIEFQYEPVAAALDYEQHISEEKLALIIDLGGGTSDFSVIRVSKNGHNKADRSQDILSSIGIHIGGTDFDRLFSLAAAMPHLGHGSMMKDAFGIKEIEVPSPIFRDLATWQKINSLYTPETMHTVKSIQHTAYKKDLLQRLLNLLERQEGHKLADEVEQAKINLTDTIETHLNMAFIEEHLTPTVARETLNNAIQQKTEQLVTTCKQALTLANVTASQVDSIFFTGGSTAIPTVRQAFLNLFPTAEIVDGNRFGSVGIGLTLEANRKFA